MRCLADNRAVVMPRECGASSTPRPLGLIIDVSGILGHPPEPVIRPAERPDRLAGDDVRKGWRKPQPRDLAAHLRELCPEFPALSYQRAQGMPGARCARSRACSVESTRVSHHGHTGNTRHSPRNGLRLIPRSPWGPGSFAPITPEKLASQELDTSVGASGPHGFAVRFKRARLQRHQRPPHPASRP
jgi:hypothetical protein